MMLIEETSVPQAAIPIEEFKAHLRLGTGFAEGSLQDPVLEGFLRAAITAIEGRTGKILIDRGFAWTLGNWSRPDVQTLPVAPVLSIVEIVLKTAHGAASVVAPEKYRLVPDGSVPQVRPTGTLLPTVPTGGDVTIRFTAGMAAGWGELPADLGQAVMLLAAHYYEFRDETSLSAGCMPFGVTSLIERYRTLRIGAGSVTGAAL